MAVLGYWVLGCWVLGLGSWVLGLGFMSKIKKIGLEFAFLFFGQKIT
jgi:hypothetical protein